MCFWPCCEPNDGISFKRHTNPGFNFLSEHGQFNQMWVNYDRKFAWFGSSYRTAGTAFTRNQTWTYGFHRVLNGVQDDSVMWDGWSGDGQQPPPIRWTDGAVLTADNGDYAVFAIPPLRAGINPEGVIGSQPGNAGPGTGVIGGGGGGGGGGFGLGLSMRTRQTWIESTTPWGSFEFIEEDLNRQRLLFQVDEAEFIANAIDPAEDIVVSWNPAAVGRTSFPESDTTEQYHGQTVTLPAASPGVPGWEYDGAGVISVGGAAFAALNWETDFKVIFWRGSGRPTTSTPFPVAYRAASQGNRHRYEMHFDLMGAHGTDLNQLPAIEPSTWWWRILHGYSILSTPTDFHREDIGPFNFNTLGAALATEAAGYLDQVGYSYQNLTCSGGPVQSKELILTIDVLNTETYGAKTPDWRPVMFGTNTGQNYLGMWDFQNQQLISRTLETSHAYETQRVSLNGFQIQNTQEPDSEWYSGTHKLDGTQITGSFHGSYLPKDLQELSDGGVVWRNTNPFGSFSNYPSAGIFVGDFNTVVFASMIQRMSTFGNQDGNEIPFYFASSINFTRNLWGGYWGGAPYPWYTEANPGDGIIVLRNARALRKGNGGFFDTYQNCVTVDPTTGAFSNRFFVGYDCPFSSIDGSDIRLNNNLVYSIPNQWERSVTSTSRQGGFAAANGYDAKGTYDAATGDVSLSTEVFDDHWIDIDSAGDVVLRHRHVSGILGVSSVTNGLPRHIGLLGAHAWFQHGSTLPPYANQFGEFAPSFVVICKPTIGYAKPAADFQWRIVFEFLPGTRATPWFTGFNPDLETVRQAITDLPQIGYANGLDPNEPNGIKLNDPRLPNCWRIAWNAPGGVSAIHQTDTEYSQWREGFTIYLRSYHDVVTAPATNPFVYTDERHIILNHVRPTVMGTLQAACGYIELRYPDSIGNEEQTPPGKGFDGGEHVPLPENTWETADHNGQGQFYRRWSTLIEKPIFTRGFGIRQNAYVQKGDCDIISFVGGSNRAMSNPPANPS